MNPKEQLAGLVEKWRRAEEDWRNAGFGQRADACKVHADELAAILATLPEPGVVCPHEAWEESGGWRKCVDCGHGWSATTPTAPAAQGFNAEVFAKLKEMQDYADEILAAAAKGVGK